MLDKFQVLYDAQCEVCQAGASWLRFLDKSEIIDLIDVEESTLPAVHPELQYDQCVREIHVIDLNGQIHVGWEAVALLARQFPSTWLIGAIGRVPPFVWLGRLVYRAVAANRYLLSKCRGGRCRISQVNCDQQKLSMRAFWTCWFAGLVIRTPLVIYSALRDIVHRIVAFFATRRRRFDFLGGKLSVLFLGSAQSDLIPVFFGEMFTAIYYDGIVFDPGSPRMRRSLRRHLARLPRKSIKGVAATHHHEEHVGNLNYVAGMFDVPVFASPDTARLLKAPAPLPWIRHFLIGQPPPLFNPTLIKSGEILRTATGELHVYAAPGHCDDHIVFYDSVEKLLIAGDAFMGSYFSTVNPDVDSRRWMETLERLVALDIEILVEGHGHVHTLRADIPDVAGLVIREDPRAALCEKLEYLRWIRGQIEDGMAEGLPLRAIEATCFPWGKTFAWERFLSDELTRLLSGGHFSRSELIRSFVRSPESTDALPTAYQVRFYTDER